MVVVSKKKVSFEGLKTRVFSIYLEKTLDLICEKDVSFKILRDILNSIQRSGLISIYRSRF